MRKNILQVFWTTTGAYIEPGVDQRKVVFTAQQKKITIPISSSLIGIFSMRLHVKDEKENLKPLNNEPEVELVIRREHVHKKKMITIFFTCILAAALALMGLDIEMDVVMKTMKVYPRKVKLFVNKILF